MHHVLKRHLLLLLLMPKAVLRHSTATGHRLQAEISRSKVVRTAATATTTMTIPATHGW
jgi:hypothetical protein